MKNLFVFMIALATSLSAFIQKKDVVDIAIGSADHTTLVAAIKAADLVSTLKGAGPFTVFAPTNAAFDKLPAGKVKKFAETGKQSSTRENPDLSCCKRKS